MASGRSFADRQAAAARMSRKRKKSAGLQAGMTGLGAVIGTIVPGAGTVAGAALGGAIGGAIDTASDAASRGVPDEPSGGPLAGSPRGALADVVDSIEKADKYKGAYDKISDWAKNFSLGGF
tara:strand:- start:313 stop:678 length:366 start_codon:yes stop_codon:yes gene_type:complete